jgi:hypothetical protein
MILPIPLVRVVHPNSAPLWGKQGIFLKNPPDSDYKNIKSGTRLFRQESIKSIIQVGDK